MVEGRLPAITAEDAPSAVADLIRDCWRAAEERPPMAAVAKRLRLVYDEVTSVAGGSATSSGSSVRGGQSSPARPASQGGSLSGVGFSFTKERRSE